MKFQNFFVVITAFLMLLVSCEKEDDPGTEPDPPRDRGEQELADQQALTEYLDTHFYNAEAFANPGESFDYRIEIDTIDAENADETPLSASPFLEAKTITREGVDYTIYILTVRPGVGEEPEFTDSTFVSYSGELLDQTPFDSSVNPVWFDLSKTIPGFTEALVEFRAGSGYEVLPDNTVKWNNDYGIGAVFLPSGLGYFNNPQGNIPPYSPLVFTFSLYRVNQTDHDQDGIASYLEDVNGDRVIGNDDTDEDLFPNYIDQDDDGDYIPTEEEIVINADGTITYPDEDGDTVPDYLDAE